MHGCWLFFYFFSSCLNSLWSETKKLVALLKTHFGVIVDEKLVSNLIHKQRAKNRNSESDAQSLIDYCNQQYAEGRAYFRMNADNNQRLNAFFYMRKECIPLLHRFGQVLSIDATHGTNRYTTQLVLFCIADNKGKTCIVAWGLLPSESIKNVRWMFEQLYLIAGSYFFLFISPNIIFVIDLSDV